jgi:UDP-3-O-acyl-N-acetylglucosamine deacetylase
MNNALLRALLADAEAWELATFSQRREAPRMFARDWVPA